MDLINKVEVRCAVLVAVCLFACSGGGVTSSIVTPPPPPPPPPPAAVDPLLYTTLDGVAAVMAPTLGTGVHASIATNPANDFVPARVASGLRANAVGESVQFPQIEGGKPNIELDRGTMEFWYQPSYNHDDNKKYIIVGTGNWVGTHTSPGTLHFGKHSSANQNKIYLISFAADSVRFEHNVTVDNYSWKAGDWLLIRITWDFTVAAGERNLHLYINGLEYVLTGEVSRGPKAFPAESPAQTIYIGSRDLTGGPIIANGVYDEFRIWNRVIP